jgi:hypothetical protein
MGTIKRVLIALFLFSLISFVSAEVQTPTYQFAKIYLTPFYRASMTANTNYTYTLAVTPPDRVSSVINAIISFNGQINGQTQTFSLWVNGQSCNNPTYSVATAFSTTGNVQFSFDCSNRITKSGNYTIEVRSAVNTGAMNGWLDLTYMNKPKGIINLFGTEYRTNEPATIWLQLKDNQGLPENEGACWVDVYAPSTTNTTHPEIIQLAPMLYLKGSEGIYYYDLIIPNITGVYMNIASCSYKNSGAFVYDVTGEETNYPTRTVVQGTYAGSPIFLNDYEDWIYTQCDSTGGGTKYCEATYDFDTKVHFANNTNYTNANLFYMGEASVKALTTLYVYNWTSATYITLPNTLTYAGSSSQPLGIGDFVSNALPTSSIISGTGIIRIRQLTSFGSNFKLFDNWLNIEIMKAQGEVTDLKGSSEMHVNNWFSGLESSNIPQQVWNYTTRNLTYYPPQVDMTNYTQVANVVWNNTNRNLTYYQNFTTPQVDMTNYTQVANYVWSYTGNVTSNILSQISTNIWNFVARYTHGEIV